MPAALGTLPKANVGNEPPSYLDLSTHTNEVPVNNRQLCFRGLPKTVHAIVTEAP